MTGTTPRIVISGASGALGRHITEQLLGKHPTSHLTLAPPQPQHRSSDCAQAGR